MAKGPARANAPYVNTREFFVSDSFPQSALRQWRVHFSQRSTLVALAGAGIALGIAGPFGTQEVLRIIPRLAYWVAISFLTYGVGFLCAAWADQVIGKDRRIMHIVAKALMTGMAVVVVVLLANWAIFGQWLDRAALLAFGASTLAIATVITVVLDMIGPDETAPTGTAAATAKAPAILSRLPLEQRGKLVALSVEDHYVRVITTRGETMILMRLADAILETAPTRGLQVHRSHWVAAGEVTAARRAGDRAILTMSDAREIPVSRANVAAIRDAGLLP